jgi:hypothetical protein
MGAATATRVEPGSTWTVVAGTYHALVGRCKLVTVYVPPKHAPHTRHETAAEARAAEAE